MAEQLFIKSAAICSSEPELLAELNLDCLSVNNNLIPAAMRRRTSLTTRMAITVATAACTQAAVDATRLPSVFASLGGEIQVTDAICRLLPDAEALLSPTQFHNSVHNTTAGYWSILNQCQASSTAIAAVDDTFAMGLLDAWTQLQFTGGDILLVCYDELWPQYLAPPIGQFACACALILSSEHTSAIGAIQVPITRPLTFELERTWSALVNAAPATAALPLLNALSNNKLGLIPLNNQEPIWFTQLECF